MPHLFFILVGILCALAGGSALNVWLWRSEHAELKGQQRSVCIKCRRALVWFELLPVLSYLLLKGRCRTCKTPIPWWYTMNEVLGGILGGGVTAFVVAHRFDATTIFLYVVLASLLLAIGLYDALYELIPLALVGVAGLTGLLQLAWSHQSILSALFAGAVAGGFFLLQYLISRGRWIGSGDVYFGVMMGCVLGWPKVLVALWFAYVLGAIIGVVLVMLQQKKNVERLPLGSFLALGTLIAIFFGDALVLWFRQWL